MSILSRPVPIFPLPSSVHFPGALQGLHIFEPRYREMVKDELLRPEGDRLIAIALLRPGYEQDYCSHQAPIHPVLCVGEIMKCEALEDGRFNVLLSGRCRVTIVSEQSDRRYRRGLLTAMQTINDMLPKEEDALRDELLDKLSELPSHLVQVAADVTSRESDFERIVDLLTFYLLRPEAAPAMQMVLAEPRLDYRVKMLLTLLERQCFREPSGDQTVSWTQRFSDN